MHDFKTEQSILQTAQIDKSRVRQDKTRQDKERSRMQALQCLYVRISNVDTQMTIFTLFN